MKNIFMLLLLSLTTQYTMAGEDDNRSSLYFGTGGNFSFLKSADLSEKGVIGASVNIGYDFSEYFAVEFRKGTSLSNGASIVLDDAMALYLKGKYQVSDEIGVYLLAGYSKTEISRGLDDILSGSSKAYAVGVDYKLSTSVSIYSDYTVLSPNVSQVGLGVNYYFDTKGLVGLPKDAPEVQSFKEKKLDEKRIEELRIKEKLEEKKKKEAEEQKKKEAEEKLKQPTIVKVNLLHKEDSQKPILVYFFELKSNDEFKRMDYEELINNEKEMLNGSIVSRSKEILKPKKMTTLEFNVKFDSAYYAVVAALNDVHGSDNWRHIVKLNAHEVNTIDLMIDHKKIMEFTK